MNELICVLAACGLFGLIKFVWKNVSKLIVTRMVCKHPELSDKKVKYLTRMWVDKEQ